MNHSAERDSHAGAVRDPRLRARLASLIGEGWEIFERFDSEVRGKRFHPFVAADYDRVLAALLALPSSGGRFVEWGSATGVITIMASMLGFEAYGIELDPALVRIARSLAERSGVEAVFAEGSFVPSGYRWRPSTGDGRLGTIGDGPSGYPLIGHPLDEFDVVFGYPWGGEEPMMLDLMKSYGRPGALLLLHGDGGVTTYRDGRVLSAPAA
ncbi:MAG: hypothetical protein ACJ79K_08060 [Gemmatimonadaceae bacterium]